MQVFGIVGRKNSGKTHLVTRLVRLASRRGLRVSTIKHAHHSFDIDRPGKDSHLHREAGAHEVLVASAERWALMHELRDAPEPSLVDLLLRLAPCDLVLVEGFKDSDLLKIEVWRADSGQPARYAEDDFIAAVATDSPASLPVPTGLPVLDLNQPPSDYFFLIKL